MKIDDMQDKALAYSKGQIELDKAELVELKDELCSRAWRCATLIDKLNRVDPYKQSKNSPYLGTANKSSTTYKVRKALGYSYP
jgi:hypothetical protein